MKSLLIVNPVAGYGAGSRAVPVIEAAMKDAGAPGDIIQTERAGHATTIAAGAVQRGVETIVAVGGDGTVHEVLNGLLAGGAAPARATLAIIPTGSGNDLARVLRIPTEVAAACRLLDGHAVRRIDVGLATALGGPRVGELPPGGRFFANILGLGFTAAVVAESLTVGPLTGVERYAKAIERALQLRWVTPAISLVADGQRLSDRIVIQEICNGQWEGGGFWVAPDARIDDGLFDIVTVAAMPQPELMELIPRIASGDHRGHDAVSVIRARQLTWESAEPVAVQADGEVLAEAATRLECLVVPAAVGVAVPHGMG
ncbi:MAG: diacylglycerol kinase family lipid kinase [Chloroflexi bacterium]|nr:diacylglycerol kinase family lipid kinase [Chloroflexota bacterium]